MKKILIVDDQGVMQRIVKNVVNNLAKEKAAGLSFIFASNGREAIAKFFSEAPDVTFLDWMMPEVQGIEALKQIRKREADSAIFMVTSLSHESYEIQAMTHGATGYIKKPVQDADFKDALIESGIL